MDKLSLFREDILGELNSAIKKMSTNEVKTVGVTNKVNIPFPFPLTSLAHLLSVREVYGCIHYADGKISLTTNLSERKSQIPFRELISNVIQKAMEKKINGLLLDQDKLILYSELFPLLRQKVARKNFQDVRFDGLENEIDLIVSLLVGMDNWK
jgi:hypothetical protein